MNVRPSKGSEAVVAQLQQMQTEIAFGGPLKTMDTSLIPKKHLPWLVKQDNVNPQRYEWLLYRQLTSRLNGRIYLPNVTKYRALEDDLIPQTSQDTLLASSTLDRLKQPAELLLQEKQHRLESALKDVALHIDEGDNRNVIMKNRTGTRWRLPTKSATSLVNNPFFKRMQLGRYRGCTAVCRARNRVHEMSDSCTSDTKTRVHSSG